ncbi:MAG: hypothetical protein LBI20_03015 [Holosporales bacterium]|nr:hypothetical protein [Holosporales bacterium]
MINIKFAVALTGLAFSFGHTSQSADVAPNILEQLDIVRGALGSIESTLGVRGGQETPLRGKEQGGNNQVVWLCVGAVGGFILASGLPYLINAFRSKKGDGVMGAMAPKGALPAFASGGLGSLIGRGLDLAMNPQPDGAALTNLAVQTLERFSQSNQ